MKVYLDGSGSMAGYAAGATSDVRPLGDAIQLISESVGRRGAAINFFAFGSRIAPIANGLDGARRYATANAYLCKGCDNQESHIDVVLSEIAAGDPKAVSIVISDLWLDNRSFTGSPQVALGGPLTDILRQHRTIGVVGLRAPFKGKITDFPVKAVYTDASEHPLFILIIGPAADVAATYRALADSDSPAFRRARRRYAAFSIDPEEVHAPAETLIPSGGGVQRSAVVSPERLPGVTQFVINQGTALAQHGALGATFDAGDRAGEGAVWSGPLKAGTRVWRLENTDALARPGCRDKAWLEMSPLGGAWRQTGPSSARFTVSPAGLQELLPGRSYYIQASLGVKQVEAPNPATRWMREWSFGADQEASVLARRPSFFPTLNLSDMATSMETALNRATSNGVDRVRFGFLLTLRR